MVEQNIQLAVESGPEAIQASKRERERDRDRQGEVESVWVSEE